DGEVHLVNRHEPFIDLQEPLRVKPLLQVTAIGHVEVRGGKPRSHMVNAHVPPHGSHKSIALPPNLGESVGEAVLHNEEEVVLLGVILLYSQQKLVLLIYPGEKPSNVIAG